MIVERFIADALRVALVLGLALLAMVLLRRRAPAARRLVLATALSGALFVPVVSSLVPSWRLPAPVSAAGLRVRHVSEALMDRTATRAPAVDEGTPIPSAAPATASSRVDWRALLAIVWGLGTILVLARLVVGQLRSRALRRGSKPAPGWASAIERAEHATGLRVPVRTTHALAAPAVTGLRTPIILVPSDSDGWDADRRHAVLLHELAHVRQGDCLMQLLADLACAVHWFDPLVWLAARRLRLERELAADEAVLAAGARASHYAESLLSIASSTWAAPVPAGALGMGERSQLAARITAIVAFDRVRARLSRAQGASLVGASSLVVLGVACSASATGGPGAATTGTPSTGALAILGASTLQPALQKIADDELERLVADAKPESAAILVLDPSTGEILADAGKAHGAAADVAVARAFVTGSTMKAIPLSAALDEGILKADERIDCEEGQWTYQGQVLHDWAPHGVVSLSDAVAVSSNVAFGKIADRLGGERLGKALRAFRFGVAPAVDGAVAGTIPARLEDHAFSLAVAGIGEVVTASPLQVAAAYGAIANGGEYVAPTRTRGGVVAPRERIMKAETARTVVSMLENVVYGDHATGGLARVDGVRVAGKTGTAAWDLPGGGEGTYASFVGIVPSTAPRYVILVGVEQPHGEGTSGGEVAAPVFARVATRILAAR